MRDQRIDVRHVVPVGDLVDHDTDSESECACGPRVEAVFRQDGSAGWLVVHNSLDGRELCEGPER